MLFLGAGCSSLQLLTASISVEPLIIAQLLDDWQPLLNIGSALHLSELQIHGIIFSVLRYSDFSSGYWCGARNPSDELLDLTVSDRPTGTTSPRPSDGQRGILSTPFECDCLTVWHNVLTVWHDWHWYCGSQTNLILWACLFDRLDIWGAWQSLKVW